MDYNNYYPGQTSSGHPSPNLAPPTAPNPNQHNNPQVQQQQQQQAPTSQPPPPPQSQQPPTPSMMHAANTMTPQNVRQSINNGPQQMQQQQHHSHYHQIQPPTQSQHGQPPLVSHSSSPHGQHADPQQHNLQPSLNGPPTQSAVQSQQQHHVHPQSPYHHNGPLPPHQPPPPPHHSHMHMQQQQQQQQPQQQPPHHQQLQQQPPQPHQQPLNHMVRSSLGPSVINHPHIGLQQPPMNHHQNFFTGPAMQQSSSVHHFPQHNQHHHAPMHPFQHQHHHHQPIMHHNHQPPMVPMHPHHHHHHHHPPPPHIQQPSGLGRNSPYYPGILQTEIRVIELNRRLQSRPIQRYPISPLPSLGNPYDEGVWWERFASEFFEDDATLTLRMQEDKPVEFTIGRTLIPKFFRTYFDGGVTDLSINLRNPKETCTHPHIITLDCDQAFIVTNNIYKHPAISSNQGVVVQTEGRLVLEFINNIDTLSIKSWKFYTKGCREYIDRSVIALGLPNAFLVEPITRQGLTKSTVSYLKMCMIMEPMQDIIVLHRHTKLDPRSCMQKLLVDRYKFRSGDDGRATTQKRRKRKPSAAPAVSGPTGRKSKANMSSMANIANNNTSLNNNMLVPPNSAPSFSLASQDVMVVGEPSMMGGDFGDDNERMITRLENTQYDPSAPAVLNSKVPDNMNAISGNNNPMSNGNVAMNVDRPSIAPSLLQQNRGQQPHQNQSMHLGDQQAPHQPQEPLTHERTNVEQPQDQMDPGIMENINQPSIQDASHQPTGPHHQLRQSNQPQQPSQQQQSHVPSQSQTQYQDQHQQHSPQVQQPPPHASSQPGQSPHQDQAAQVKPQELQQHETQKQPSPEQTVKQEESVTLPQSQDQAQTGPTGEFMEQNAHEFAESNHENQVSKNQDHSIQRDEDSQQLQPEPESQTSHTDGQTSYSQGEQVEEQQVKSEPDQKQTLVEGVAVVSNQIDQEQRLNELEERESNDSVKDTSKAQVLEINSIEQVDMNHTNSVQTSNEESSSNSSQLPCAPDTTATAREQTQPVNNGVS